MRETKKVLCIVIFMLTLPASAVVWTDDRPTETVRILRIVCPLLSVLAIGLFLKMHFRADIVPDYLRRAMGVYFNRGGFCFSFKPVVVDGMFYLLTYFQNQSERPCHARVALRPARGFWMGRGPIETVTLEIECEAAAFGIAKVAIPLPEQVQGKRTSFEVGASVNYPLGRGRTLRFQDGLLVRKSADFTDTIGTALMLTGGLVGKLVWSRPATATFELPVNVATEIPDDVETAVVTLWKFGDPPLDQLRP